jgi:hypothetical protein
MPDQVRYYECFLFHCPFNIKAGVLDYRGVGVMGLICFPPAILFSMYTIGDLECLNYFFSGPWSGKAGIE